MKVLKFKQQSEAAIIERILIMSQNTIRQHFDFTNDKSSFDCEENTVVTENPLLTSEIDKKMVSDLTSLSPEEKIGQFDFKLTAIIMLLVAILVISALIMAN